MIAWILYAVASGIMEAGIFSFGGANTEWPFNIHIYLTLPRIVVFVMCVCFFGKGKIKGMASYAVLFIALFPFFHDGSYYQARHFIDYPPYHFFSQSETTNAALSFGPINRTLLMLLGIACFYLIQLKWKQE